MISAFLFTRRERAPAPSDEALAPSSSAPPPPAAAPPAAVRPERAALKLVEIAASVAAIVGLVLIASARADWIALPDAGAVLSLASTTVTLKGAL